VASQKQKKKKEGRKNQKAYKGGKIRRQVKVSKRGEKKKRTKVLNYYFLAGFVSV
jgi:hypothetical protein